MRWRLTPLTGACVFAGHAVGRVRVAGGPPGDADVLVASRLEPGDIPELFSCVAAVLEHGGLTSHAAITARELGIPMLVEVAGAAGLLAPGDRVFVDAELGRILRAEPAGPCAFCDPVLTPTLRNGDRLRVIEDTFPVVRSHLLVVPRRHVTDPSGLDRDDWAELGALLDGVRDRLRAENRCTDLNLALNVGRHAGQTVEHLHWHLLPRTPGDDPDPRGGVRRLVAEPFRPYPAP